MLVVSSVVAFPLVFVVSSNWIESLFGDRTLDRASHSAEIVARELRANPAGALEEIERIAREKDQRIRVIDGGNVAVFADHVEGSSLLFEIGDLFYGPDRIKGLRALEAREGPIATRPEIEEARAAGTATGCEQSVLGNLYVCHAARHIDVQDARIVHVQGSSRRAVQALFEARRQLVKLTLFVLVLGLVLSRWMARRMVDPVEALREEVLERASAAVPKADLLREPHKDEVGDLAAAFNSLLSALRDRTRANEAFLADLAHELKSPIAAIRSCADRLADEGAPRDAERARKLADVLVRSSRRLDVLVRQFLDLARAEAGLPGEEHEEIDVAGLLEGIVQNTRDDPRFSKVDVVADARERPRVRGVAHRLESAFRNVVDNAASFARASVTVAIRADAEHAIVEIADDGSGIAEADLSRIFDRFFTTRPGEGSGLGLALTRAVVEAHGGTIRAESPAGGGARFILRLPFTRISRAAL
jgi:two-component system sensor histidine kinase ChvG